MVDFIGILTFSGTAISEIVTLKFILFCDDDIPFKLLKLNAEIPIYMSTSKNYLHRA